MRSLWHAWERALERTEPGTSLALFRVGMGLAVLVTLGSLVSGGLVDDLYVDRAHGGMFDARPGWTVRQLGGATPTVVWSLVVGGLIGGAATAVGLGGRLVPFATLQLCQMLLGLSPYADAAYDGLLFNGLWLCVLAPTTRTLSVDALLRTGQLSSGAPVGVWGRYLVVFQLVVLYTATGWQKLSSGWVPGGELSALYHILQMPAFQRAPMDWVARYHDLTRLATAVTWWWEVLAPLLLVGVWATRRPRTGRPGHLLGRLPIRSGFVAVGLIMHGASFALLELGPFPFTTLAYYPALFHPRELAVAWRALTAPFTGRSAPRGRAAGSPAATTGSRGGSPPG